MTSDMADTSFWSNRAADLIKQELARRLSCGPASIEVTKEDDGGDAYLVIKYQGQPVANGLDGSIQGAVDAAIRGIRFKFPKMVIKP